VSTLDVDVPLHEPPATPGRAQVAPADGALLTTRALNRALLERQMLLGRRAIGVADALEHLVGLQAQVPQAPYLGLWSRIDGFQPDELSALIECREAVRIALMRWTSHLVTSADCVTLRPLVQPVLERRLHAGFGRHLDGVSLERLAVAGRSLLEEQPYTATELGRLLRRRWPGRESSALANAVSALVPLVQVPPRGLFNQHGRALLATAESWLGRPLQPAGPSAIDELVLRYLAAFGPASARDVRTWSGLTGLNDVFDRLRPRLRRFVDERGRELLDVPGGALPDPDTPAPPRFLPEYDNVLLSHADRSRIVSDAYRKKVMTYKTVLVDGFVRGIWRIVRRPDCAILVIRPIERISREDAIGVVREGRRLLAFAAGEHEQREVRFVTGPRGRS